MTSKKAAGFSVLEMLIAVAILGGVVFMCNVGLKLINSFGRQKITADMEIEAQRVIYMIERDVRNSFSYDIISLDPAKPEEGGNQLLLTLQEFMAGAYTPNLKTILDSPEAVVFYQIVEAGGQTYLNRHLTKGGNDVDQKFLIDALDISQPIFKPIPSYDGVSIKLTLNSAFSKKDKKSYSVSVLKWFNFKKTSS